MSQGKSTKVPFRTGAKDISLTCLCQKTQLPTMPSSNETTEVPQAPTSGATLTKAYLDNFLNELRAEIGSLKTKLKACMHNIKQDINGLGERVNKMELTQDSRSEDFEVLCRKVSTLKDQQINFQLKQEDLENQSWRNNICIWGIPKNMEGPDIMSFVADPLHAIWKDPDTSPPMLDKAHRVAGMQGRPDQPPDILSQVHFYIEKEAILQVSQKKAALVHKGHNPSDSRSCTTYPSAP
ncbi:hypothetical protein NDU88_006675 [Pleurodeles waltl]|uniref:Uncharacterized protein n=1 Tax=Pleurodeles waltl TaxID=8319 RepID=A0AAV7NSJ5_PLEWA|nr:hypothetical protein NDU88_006675 [Pleurodeles waltl]